MPASFKYRLFAGVCWWRNITEDEKTITCGKLAGGEVCYGIVKELGLPSKTGSTPALVGKEMFVTIDGTTYKAVIKEAA